MDCVFAAEGAQLWPEAYDYRAEGMKRLEAQARRTTEDEVTAGALLWQELVGILGDRKLAPLLKALGEAAVDPADPAASVKPVILAASNDPRLGQWWLRAEKLFFTKQARSGFQAKVFHTPALSAARRRG